jgi:HK97 family phage prohead protease
MAEHKADTEQPYDVVNGDAWRQTASSGGASSDVVLRKEFISEVEAGEDDRTIKFIISTGDPDREKDVISPDGWNTSNYLKNPVVLFAHDYGSLPVARATNVRLDGSNLIAEAEFADAALNPMAEQVYQMLRQGYLRGASVGFRPLEFQYNEQRGGVDFAKQELLEFSVVPVPANPGALMSAGVSSEGATMLKTWAKQTLAVFADEDESDDDSDSSDDSDSDVSDSDQLDDFLDTIRKAMNDIKVAVRETIKNVDEFQNTFQYTAVRSVKGMTPSNPSDFGMAPLSATWKKPSLEDFTDETWDELSSSERRSIARHFAWAESSSPDSFGELKLPHHKPNGDVVWRGVASAAAFLDATKLPSADVGAVQRHLAGHYKQFDRVAPWERDGAAWAAYTKARAKLTAKLGARPTEDQVAYLLDDHGFEDEAITLVSTSPQSAGADGAVAAPFPPATPVDGQLQTLSALLVRLSGQLDAVSGQQTTSAAPYSDSFVLEIDDATNEDIDDDGFEVNADELRDAMKVAVNESVSAVVGAEMRSAMNEARGRLD